jgi:hypothetical protein
MVRPPDGCRAHAGEQLRIEGAEMTPKVSCVVVAEKGHIWHSAGLAGGREYVVIVRPDGEDEDVEAVASRGLYPFVEPGDRLTLEREWFMASPHVQPVQEMPAAA